MINFAAQAQFLDGPLSIGAGFSVYCSAEAAAVHDQLVNTYKWTIVDNGQNCSLTAPIQAPNLQSDSDTGYSNIDNVTKVPSLIFDVYCSGVNNTLTLYEGENVVTTNTCTTDDGFAKITASNVNEGFHVFQYTESIGSEETSKSPSITVQVDLTSPNINDAQVQYPTNGALINANLAGFRGQMIDEDGGQLMVLDNGQLLCETGFVEQDDQWICFFRAQLSNGLYNLEFAVKDAAGNVSQSLPFNIEINSNIISDLNLTANDPLMTDEDGSGETLVISLATTPVDDVVLSLLSTDVTEGNINTSSITISPEQWNRPNVLRVTGVDDAESDGDQSYTINIDFEASNDPVYQALDRIILNGINLDNEPHADLSVSVSNCSNYVNPDDQVLYNVHITNTGTEDVVGALVDVTTSADLSIDYWTCAVAYGSAQCAGGVTGEGDLDNVSVSLESGSELYYSIYATTGGEESLDVSMFANVFVGPSGDANLTNDSSSDTDEIKSFVFISSFESSEVGCN